MSLFLRKCVLEKEIYVVDLEPFRRLEALLSNLASNANQIAKHVNTTDEVKASEVHELQHQISDMAKELLQIHGLLLKRTDELKTAEAPEGGNHGDHQNTSD